jgi:hypothetical protein
MNDGNGTMTPHLDGGKRYLQTPDVDNCLTKVKPGRQTTLYRMLHQFLTCVEAFARTPRSIGFRDHLRNGRAL